MKEIVINRCFGGFGLSLKAVMRYAELKGIKLYPHIDKMSKEIFEKVYGEKPTIEDPRVLFVSYTKVPPEEYERIVEEEEQKPAGTGRFEKSYSLYFSERDIPRDDIDLVKVVKELKEKANGKYAKLEIVKIPNNVKWQIEEYDGSEHIAECHRTWQ